MDDQQLELVCFTLISAAGAAKSSFIQAIDEARAGKFNEADELIKQGEEYLLQAHAPHSEMVQKEAAGEHTEVNILFVHAEDQMATTETFKVMAEQFITEAREMAELKAELAALRGAGAAEMGAAVADAVAAAPAACAAPTSAEPVAAQ